MKVLKAPGLLEKSKGFWKKGKKAKELSFYDKRQAAWKNKELTVKNMYDGNDEHPEITKKISTPKPVPIRLPILNLKDIIIKLLCCGI